MVLDIIIILLIASGFYWGYSKGIIGTIFFILSIAISLIVASKFVTGIADMLINSLNFHPRNAFFIGLMILFFASLLVVRFIGTKVESMFEALNINFINKLAGGLLMGLIFLFLTTFGVSIFTKNNKQTPNFIVESSVYPIVKPLGETAHSIFLKVQPKLKEYQTTIQDNMNNAKDSSEEYLQD